MAGRATHSTEEPKYLPALCAKSVPGLSLNCVTRYLGEKKKKRKKKKKKKMIKKNKGARPLQPAQFYQNQVCLNGDTGAQVKR